MTFRRAMFRGVIAYLPTNFTSDNRIDEYTFAANTRKLSYSGVHGVFCLGSAGEFFNVTAEEYRRLVEIFQAEANPDVLRVVGCAVPGLTEAIQRATYAAEYGADAILFVPPYFVPLNPEERRRCFIELSAACPSLGIIHYNTGYARHVQLEPADYEALAELPNLWGSKQGTTDMLFWLELMRRTPGLTHMSLEWLFVPTMMQGGTGMFSAVASLSPRFALAWYDACIRRDWDTALVMQHRYNQFLSEVYLPLSQQGYTDLAIDKALVAICGFLEASDPRPPVQPIPRTTRTELRRTIETRFGFLLPEGCCDV